MALPRFAGKRSRLRKRKTTAMLYCTNVRSQYWLPHICVVFSEPSWQRTWGVLTIVCAKEGNIFLVPKNHIGAHKTNRGSRSSCLFGMIGYRRAVRSSYLCAVEVIPFHVFFFVMSACWCYRKQRFLLYVVRVQPFRTAKRVAATNMWTLIRTVNVPFPYACFKWYDRSFRKIM